MLNQQDILNGVVAMKIVVGNETDLIIGGGLNAGTELGSTEGTMHIVKDLDGHTYIPGSGLAGVLLRKYQRNLSGIEESDTSFQQFWGINESDNRFFQSHINIGNGILQSGSAHKVELKDAVKINPKTGAGDDGGKFSYTRLFAGSQFEIPVEVKIRKGFNKTKFVQLSKFLLKCFKEGVRVGAKENKDYGHLKLIDYTINYFQAGKDFEAWKAFRRTGLLRDPDNYALPEINELTYIKDEKCILRCRAALAGGLLTAVKAVGKEHDKEQQKRGDQDWLDAESILGPVRHRAYRILNTVFKEEAESQFGSLFGHVPDGKNEGTSDKEEGVKKARISVSASEIKNVHDHTQKNIAIDRFTGGTLDRALMTTKYVYKNLPAESSPPYHIYFKIEIRNPKDNDIPLILFVLRDMATRDLAFGANKGIGLGIFEKVQCTMEFEGEGEQEKPIDFEIYEDGNFKSGQLKNLSKYKFVNVPA